MANFVKRLLVGRPLASDEQQHQRLGNFSALAVFASDALSSVAYATEEILLALMVVGPVLFHLTIPISIGIVSLLLIVMISYRQTIFAYPNGGGAYTVAKDNLGQLPGLLAGAALLIDYVLTVSVSVAAGIAAITSALPELLTHRVLLCLIAVSLVTIGNLRGVRESGKLFAPPAYGFMIGLISLIVVGFFRYAQGDSFITSPEEKFSLATVSTSVPFFLLLRAFASGCTAFTGIEAISNGVTAFRKPESENAARVLRWLATILAFLFLGISILAWLYGVVPNERETVLSQIARSVFGTGFFYLFIQISTMAILVLAANTSFNDFPRLASLMAQDRFLPRQLRNLGDRLVYSNGILLLAISSCLLIVLFSGNTHHLIPLYAVGVFLSFTLSQAGMVAHHYRLREPHWQSHLVINLVGAVSTAAVLAAVLIAKFSHGAWIVCLVIPLLVKWFYAVERHYKAVGKELAIDMRVPPRKLKHIVIVPVANIHKGVLSAIEYAQSLGTNVRAVSIVPTTQAKADIERQWSQWVPAVPLEVIESPFRSLTEPLTDYIREIDAKDPNELITVVIPSFVPARWWHNVLHNQSSVLLRLALRNMKNVVITNVHTHLSQ